MNKNINILIADDHQMLLKGLEDELKNYNYSNIITAKDGAEALKELLKNKIDIAILDIEMPLLTGIEIIKKCEVENLKTKFIILTSHKESRFIYKANSLNISGYLLKDEPFSEIENCINSVLNNKNYYSKSFNIIFEKEISPEILKIKLLSPSERTIVRMIGESMNSQQIAEALLISLRTVQKHRSNIIGKLELSSDHDALTNWAFNNKILLSSI